MKLSKTPLLNIPRIYSWAQQTDFSHVDSSKFIFVLRVVAPSICPQLRTYTNRTDRTVINWTGWSRDCWKPKTLAAMHLFDRGGELYELGQIGRLGPRRVRPSRYMLNDYPIVLNDPVLESLLSCLYRLRSRLSSPRPARVPLPERVRQSRCNSLAFDTACNIAAYYRWLIKHHPNAPLREPDGTRTFHATELEARFGDALEWANRVAMGDITRPKNTRCTIYSERDFRIRQFVGLMRSNILFGMQRQEAVGLVVEIARAFPGRYPLSRENVETILDRRAKDLSQLSPRDLSSANNTD